MSEKYSDIRLSQCMIVKNEEKNIEQALGWAKGYAFEQIVVDTGSTDKTVELAEKLGATVYHFEWINDFSAAKNFAMDKATGAWIAIMDADEYVPHEDMPALMSLLEKINNMDNHDNDYDAISFPRWNLDDEGNVNSIIRTSRIFRNRPDLRYKGRIHEQVVMNGDMRFDADNVRLMHTGYLESEIQETGKAKRNISILRAELAEDPHNLNTKAYLADSLWMAADSESLREAHDLFLDVINGTNVAPVMKKTAYAFTLTKYLNDPQMQSEGEALCQRAREEFPDDIDIKFFQGVALCNKEEYENAINLLAECVDKVGTVAEYGNLSYVSADPGMLYNQILRAAYGAGDIDKVIEYATIALSTDKTRHGILSSYIAVLLKTGKSNEEILELLSIIYDLKSINDLILVARAAKDIGAIDLARLIVSIGEQAT